MDESALLFTLSYILFALCFVFPTNAFISLGLTVENILSKFIDREIDDFILHHIKRTSYTIIVHSSLLLGYRVCLSWVTNTPIVDGSFNILNIFMTVGLMLSLSSIIIIYRWSKDNWENHPISKRLALFCDNNTSWRILATDINIEYRRLDKVIINCSSVVDVIVTDNWIIKTTPYTVYVAHQSDTSLSLDTADTHTLSASGTGSAQFLNIRASFTRRGNHHFNIRLNALDFKDLEEKLRRPVIVGQNIVFHRTRADQFLEVFREQVSQNPHYHPTEEVELCIGCMVKTSDVKLVKHCLDEQCRTCYCRPMWCMDCMARWFASRQEENHSEEWLSSKCTCPVCRSVFCILDVSPIEETAQHIPT